MKNRFGGGGGGGIYIYIYILLFVIRKETLIVEPVLTFIDSLDMRTLRILYTHVAYSGLFRLVYI